MTRGAQTGTKHLDLRAEELIGIVERTRASLLDDEDRGKLKAAIETLGFMTSELEKKGASIRRLRQLIFGPQTEKTSNIFGAGATSPAESEQSTTTVETAPGEQTDGAADNDGPTREPSTEPKKKKRKGHGRNGVAAYSGAERVEVPHPELKKGDPCPECPKGKLYELKEPATMVRVRGMAPLLATVFALQRLRCNACGKVFTAPAPQGEGTEKYDATAVAMVGTLKYGTGMPFNRLEKLQQNLGIPLPAGTQWELVKEASDKIEPVFKELKKQAAQGEVLHNDDTTARVLELMKDGGGQKDEPPVLNKDGSERKSITTSGIVAEHDGHKIALFYTGLEHAGENLAELLKQRAKGLDPPLHMSDALSQNIPEDLPEGLAVIWANCLSHARRKFVDVASSFPDEVLHVLTELGKVYKHDATARVQKMTPKVRLCFHQEHSKPIMEDLQKWLKRQLDDKLVEPNSGLGEAIKYMLKRWDKFCRFYKVAGAPLDNNILERALKKAILHRKNAFFYKTTNGAHVGDIFMSLIHTTELGHGNPFDYLTELLRHKAAVKASPADWLPWNYKDTLAQQPGS